LNAHKQPDRGDAAKPEAHDVFGQVRDKLLSDYYDPGKVKDAVAHFYRKGKSSEQAATELAKSLHDPWTEFQSKNELARIDRDYASGMRESGIWISPKTSGYPEVQAVLKGYSAYDTPVRAGDRIVSVNGTDCFNKDEPAVEKMMTAQIGSSLKVEFQTPDGQRIMTEFQVRETEQQKASAQVIVGPKGEKILYATLPEFQLASMNEFDDAIDKVLKENPDSNMPMILNLRGNTGGSIKSELYFASEFERDGVALKRVMRDGKGVAKSDLPVYQLPDGDGSPDGQRVKYLRDARVVVLIDDASRSAAEGVTMSLADHGRLTAIVGHKSFGKGRFYDDFTIGGGHLRESIGMLLSPTGKNWDGEGIYPTISVERNRDPKAQDDQLNAAIAALENAPH